MRSSQDTLVSFFFLACFLWVLCTPLVFIINSLLFLKTYFKYMLLWFLQLHLFDVCLLRRSESFERTRNVGLFQLRHNISNKNLKKKNPHKTHQCWCKRNSSSDVHVFESWDLVWFQFYFYFVLCLFFIRYTVRPVGHMLHPFFIPPRIFWNSRLLRRCLETMSFWWQFLNCLGELDEAVITVVLLLFIPIH